jgi:O-antigen/teichoic acid export membrane protein
MSIRKLIFAYMIANNSNFGEKQNLESEQNSNAVNSSVHKIAQGTVILFIGLIIGMLFSFISRILFARFFAPSDYGIFSLGITLLSLFAAIGTLGLSGGATRQIAFYRGRGEEKKVHFIILWSLIIAAVSSLIFSLIIFLSSDFIAIKILNKPVLSITLKILSVGIPFLVLIMILGSVFLGFKKVNQQVYFNDLLKNFLFILFLIAIITLGLSFEWGIVVYVLSIIIAFIAFFIYFIKKKLLLINLHQKNKEILYAKELLIFSIPLLFVTILDKLITWTDILFLGYFKTSYIVGLYSAASILGGLITASSSAMILIYTPINSDLYAKNNLIEMRQSYYILTKWLCATVLPFTLLFILFPREILNILYGQEYVLAGTVLQILTIGFFMNTLLGLNGATLIAMGKTKFLMFATFITAIINIILNFLLIPIYGITGAAIASMISIILINVIRSIKLYSISKIHSIKKNILKPIFMACVLFFVIYFFVNEFLTITYWILSILFIVFIILYAVSLLLTKSFDKEDIEMLLKIEKKTGLNFIRIKRLMKRFI